MRIRTVCILFDGFLVLESHIFPVCFDFSHDHVSHCRAVTALSTAPLFWFCSAFNAYVDTEDAFCTIAIVQVQKQGMLQYHIHGAESRSLAKMSSNDVSWFWLP